MKNRQASSNILAGPATLDANAKRIRGVKTMNPARNGFVFTAVQKLGSGELLNVHETNAQTYFDFVSRVSIPCDNNEAQERGPVAQQLSTFQ